MSSRSMASSEMGGAFGSAAIHSSNRLTRSAPRGSSLTFDNTTTSASPGGKVTGKTDDDLVLLGDRHSLRVASHAEDDSIALTIVLEAGESPAGLVPRPNPPVRTSYCRCEREDS